MEGGQTREQVLEDVDGGGEIEGEEEDELGGVH